MKKSILIILLLLFSMTASASQVIYSPEEITVDKHEYFDIDIIISPTQSIDTIGINKISWNSDIIVLDKIKKGTFYLNPLVWIEGTRGKNNLTFMCMASQETKETQGILATLTFRAREDGTTYITSDSDDIDLVISGNRLHDISVKNCKVIVGSGLYPSTEMDLDFSILYIIIFLPILVAIVLFIFIRRKKRVPVEQNRETMLSKQDFSEEEDVDMFE
jgi:hypothetical protein